MNRLILQWLFLIATAFSSINANSKPTLEDYSALGVVSHMKLSPDGAKVAFVKRAEVESKIIVYSLEKNKTITGAKLGNLKIKDLYFIGNDELIFVASRVRKVLGIRGELDLSTAFVMDIQSGELRPLLTPGDVVYEGQSGLGDIVGLTPDKKYALMPAYVGITNARSSSRLALVKTSLTRKRSPRIVKKGTPSTIDYFVNSKGIVVAEERFNNSRNSHRIFSFIDGKRIEIYRKETEMREISPVGLTADEDALVIKAGNTETDRYVLYTLSLKGGKISEPVFSRKDADIESIIFQGVSRIVKGVRYSGFNPSYEFFDKKLQQRVTKLLAQFPEQSVYLNDWSAEFDNILLSVSGGSYSGNYFLSRKNKSLEFIASSRPNIASKDIHPIIKFNYPASDGLNIPALLTVPSSKVNTLVNLPTVMLPHGGPESYDSVEFDWLAQSLANQGYLVIQPQFRGSSGFGLAHTRAGHGEWGKKMQSDLSDGLEVLVKEGIVDPKRICIVGWSYGGYAALAGAAFTPEQYQCAVSINGISDLELMLKHERKEYGKSHWIFSYWQNQIAGDSENAELSMRNLSPINHVENVKIPILLIHGNKDRVVQMEQSELMMEALEDLNKPVVFKSFEGEDHQLSGSKVRAEVLSLLINFVNQRIGN